MNTITTNNIRWGRRHFLAGAVAPMVLPRWARGQAAAAQMIELAVIGLGRGGRANLLSLLPNTLKYGVRVVALCDVDSKRLESAKRLVDEFYAKAIPNQKSNCATYLDYRKAIARPDLDGVIIATPDHQHAGPAMAAAAAGKHIFLELPLTFTHAEGFSLVKAVRQKKVVLQTALAQRFSPLFRHACELVRNGRLGKVISITVLLPIDEGTGRTKIMPVPPNLDFNRWLGPRELAEYTEDRVHPQSGFSRPGWMHIQDYSRGALGAWGTSMFDIAQWANGSEKSGLVELRAHGEFPDRGLFNVPTKFTLEGKFANGVRLLGKIGEPGVSIEGDKGKLWVSRQELTTDPVAIASEKIGPGEILLPVSRYDMIGDFISSIRKGKEPVCPVEVGHRSSTFSNLAHIAMKLERKLTWDPVVEAFPNDYEANAMLDYPHREET